MDFTQFHKSAENLISCLLKAIQIDGGLESLIPYLTQYGICS